MVEILNAVISKATLGFDDHGFLDAWLYLDLEGGCSQGFGGYVLQVPKESRYWTLKSVAGHYIWRVLEIAGVQEWKDLPGKAIRIKRKDGLIRGIGHILKEDWFIPSEDFKACRENG